MAPLKQRTNRSTQKEAACLTCVGHQACLAHGSQLSSTHTEGAQDGEFHLRNEICEEQWRLKV